MSVPITELVRQATEHINAGRWQDAERVWQMVHEREPRNPEALFSLGVHAMHRSDLETALAFLQQARRIAPRDLKVFVALIKLHGTRADAEAEREAIDAALAIDPYFVPALLARGSWQERFATPVSAAVTYANALKISPPPAQWPAAYLAQLRHAQSVVERNSLAMSEHLQQQLAPLQAALPPSSAGRWSEAISIMAGRSQPYHSHSNQLHVPRLAPIPFYERDAFPWLSKLEQSTDLIREELLGLLQNERERFSPYIRYNPGEPVNQWAELNHSVRWSAFHLWRSGEPVEDNLKRCPQTARILTELQLVEIEGLCPNAMFSALAPKTRIPPHHGETNARLVAHLPLIVPEGCSYRVGHEWRHWKVGETLIFDDTIEHEARNDSDELRVILIFDLWNPQLAPAERELVKALAAGARSFRG